MPIINVIIKYQSSHGQIPCMYTINQTQTYTKTLYTIDPTYFSMNEKRPTEINGFPRYQRFDQ
jgi:hypothetical protein